MGVLTFLFVVILGIMSFRANGQISKLEQQNRNLNARLKRLEGGQDADNIDAEKPAPPPVPDPKPAPIEGRKPVPEMGLQPPVIAASAAAPAKTGPERPSFPAQIPKLPKLKKPSRNLEELIGGQWSVWVGGLALLVGAVLLIRFSIEAGFFGPGARILMATALGLVLLAAGEWLKRSDDKMLKGRLGEAAQALKDNASVPGLLSAVGIFTLLGTAYASHALYGFISAPVSFALLGMISLGAMALSLRQGPLLAAIGLLASLATPLLVQTKDPNFLALVGYLLVIGLAALALARRTNWRWLETGVVFGWLFWLFMSLRAATGGQLALWSAFLAIGFGVTVWAAEERNASADKADERLSSELTDLGLQPILAIVWGAIASVLISYVVTDLHTKAGGIPTSGTALSIGAILALCGAAVFFRQQYGHLIMAGLLAAGLGLLSGPNTQLIIFAITTFLVVMLSIREAFSRDIHPLAKQPDIFWAVFAVGIGILGLVGSEIFHPKGWSDQIYAGWAFIYSAVFAASAIYFDAKSRPALITTCLTLGAALAWTVGAAYAFDGIAFSLAASAGAALMVAAFAVLRLPGARLALLGLTGLVFAHALLVQFHLPNALSERPIFNGLWIYLALPTAILGMAGYLLHGEETKSKSDMLVNGVIEAAALAGLALFAVFQIRHLSNGGQVYADKFGFAELGLQVSVGLCFTLAGLSKRFASNMVLSKMAEVISYATLAIFAIGSLLGRSPFFNSSEAVTGNIIFNSLTTGLLVPTILLGLCAYLARGRRPKFYVNLLGGLALAGAISWITAMIRFLYNGSRIEIFMTRFGDLELWTISAIWLALGIALLALGVWRRERALRIASGIVIILTVFKAFLIDMAGLEGVLRALSFVALGLILIVIGRAYQRYWLSDGADNSSALETGEKELV